MLYNAKNGSITLGEAAMDYICFGNGERVLVNFLGALEPVLRRGALAAAQAQAEQL